MMNCAWCGANADGSDSHGICTDCEERMVLAVMQRQFDKVESHVEKQAALFAQECEAILREQEVAA